MKKSILVVLAVLVLSFAVFAVSSDEGRIYKAHITIIPLSAIVGYYQLQGIFGIGNMFATGLKFDYFNYTVTGTSAGFYGLTFHVPFRFYVNKEGVRGLYVGPHLRFQSTSITDGETTYSGVRYGAGAEFGYTLILKGFVMEFGLRASYMLGSLVDNNGNEYTSWSNLQWGIPIAIGFAF